MRPTRLWTALLLSGMLLPSTAMAQKSTYTAPNGPTEMAPPASSNPYHRPADHPAAMGMGGMMPPGYGMMPQGPSPYGYDAMQVGYAGQMGPGPMGPGPGGPGPMMMDPSVAPMGYGGPGCATCGPNCSCGPNCNCGPGTCVGGNCAGGGCCSGLLGFGLLGCQEYCGFGRGIGNPWDMSAYGGICTPRRFDVLAEATIFSLTSNTRGLNFTSQGGANNFVLGADDIDYSHQGGVRISAMRTLTAGTELEFSFLGTGNWSGSSSVTGNGDLFSPFSAFGTDPVGGWAETDQGDFNQLATSNTFNSFELNLRRPWTSANCWWQGAWWAGIRYVRVEDDAILINQGQTGSLNYGVGATNDLWGAQLGGDVALRMTQRLTLSGFAEVGVYGNRAKQDSVLNLNDGGAFIREDAISRRASMVTEGGLVGTFQVTPRVAFRAGYQVVFIDGIALGSDNFNFDTGLAANFPAALAGRSTGVADNGSLLYHGATAGFDWRW